MIDPARLAATIKHISETQKQSQRDLGHLLNNGVLKCQKAIDDTLKGLEVCRTANQKTVNLQKQRAQDASKICKDCNNTLNLYHKDCERRKSDVKNTCDMVHQKLNYWIKERDRAKIIMDEAYAVYLKAKEYHSICKSRLYDAERELEFAESILRQERSRLDGASNQSERDSIYKDIRAAEREVDKYRMKVDSAKMVLEQAKIEMDIAKEKYEIAKADYEAKVKAVSLCQQAEKKIPSLELNISKMDSILQKSSEVTRFCTKLFHLIDEIKASVISLFEKGASFIQSCKESAERIKEKAAMNKGLSDQRDCFSMQTQRVIENKITHLRKL